MNSGITAPIFDVFALTWFYDTDILLFYNLGTTPWHHTLTQYLKYFPGGMEVKWGRNVEGPPIKEY